MEIGCTARTFGPPYIYKLRTIQFRVPEVRIGRQDLHDEIRTGRSPLDDLNANVLAILDKYPFESARSITDTLRLAHSTMLLHLHDSIGFRSFRLH
jgi:hypothetical protein